MDSNQMGKIKLNLKPKFLYKINIFYRKGTKLILEKEHIDPGLVKLAIVKQSTSSQKQRSLKGGWSSEWQ